MRFGARNGPLPRMTNGRAGYFTAMVNTAIDWTKRE